MPSADKLNPLSSAVMPILIGLFFCFYQTGECFFHLYRDMSISARTILPFSNSSDSLVILATGDFI